MMFVDYRRTILTGYDFQRKLYQLLLVSLGKMILSICRNANRLGALQLIRRVSLVNQTAFRINIRRSLSFSLRA